MTLAQAIRYRLSIRSSRTHIVSAAYCIFFSLPCYVLFHMCDFGDFVVFGICYHHMWTRGTFVFFFLLQVTHRTEKID